MYVARYTRNPEYDVQRRWVGYMHPQGTSEREVAEALVETSAIRFPFDPFESDDNYERAIEYALENADIRYHEVAQVWLHVHHASSLSCWPLEADNEHDAIEEARRLDAGGEIEWCGWGHRTLGVVRFVARVNDDLAVFECDDTAPEN